jgi:hypothetical protein
MSRNVQRHATRTTRTLTCVAVAVPALLVAGCSLNSGGGGDDSGSSSGGKSQGASKPAPVKYKELPDACQTISSKTVKDLTPKPTDAGGKRIGTGDTGDSGSCLWNGLNKYDYRQLTVSLKRFDSDPSRGSGNKLASAYQSQQSADVEDEKGVKDLKKSPVSGIGDQGDSISYQIKKGEKKKKAEKFAAERLVIRSANAVVTVDYEGTGFESSKLPKSDDLKKKAEKAAKEAVAALK